MEKIKAWWAATDTQALELLVLTWGKNIIFALAIFYIGKWLSKRATNVIKKLMRRSNVDETLVGFVGNIARALIMAFVVIAALTKLGVNTNSLAAAIAAAGLAIGLALQGSLSNFAAGIMLILFRPFKKGDYIEASDTAGIVEEINIFTTTMRTPDNKIVIVPNSSVTGNTITNYSRQETRRLDLVFGIGYDDDIKKAKSILEDVITKSEFTLKDPEPTVAVLELGDSSINFAFRPWVKTADFWPARFELMEEVKHRFDAEGISIPFPQRDVHMYHVEGPKNDNEENAKAA